MVFKINVSVYLVAWMACYHMVGEEDTRYRCISTCACMYAHMHKISLEVFLNCRNHLRGRQPRLEF